VNSAAACNFDLYNSTLSPKTAAPVGTPETISIHSMARYLLARHLL
jgi:hypothetical protein